MARKALSLALLTTLAVVVAACEPAARRTSIEYETASGELQWPEPPLSPRIRYVRSVTRPQDLGIEPSFWRRVGEFFVGAKDEWFIRPTGISARGSVIYVADPGAQVVWILDSAGGQWRTLHEADGHPLVSPVAVTTGRSGRIYVADSYLAKVFIYDDAGALTKTIESPHLGRPAGLAYDDNADHLYVADSIVHGIWIFDGDGTPLGMIGERGTGPGTFNFPTHVAVDPEGNLYVTDALNFRLQVFTAEGRFDGQFGRQGNYSGDFASPKGVGVDSKGHVYVVDALFDAVQIFDQAGRYLLTFGERGIERGQFWLPSGVFIDRRDRIYVADAYNQRIQIFEYLQGGNDA